MAANTVAFTLTSAAYQDVSEGYDNCSFRLVFIGQKNNVIRVHLGTSLPDPDTEHYDEFKPSSKTEEGWQAHFTSLADSHVYVRAARDTVRLVAYRK